MLPATNTNYRNSYKIIKKSAFGNFVNSQKKLKRFFDLLLNFFSFMPVCRKEYKIKSYEKLKLADIAEQIVGKLDDLNKILIKEKTKSSYRQKLLELATKEGSNGSLILYSNPLEDYQILVTGRGAVILQTLTPEQGKDYQIYYRTKIIAKVDTPSRLNHYRSFVHNLNSILNPFPNTQAIQHAVREKQDRFRTNQPEELAIAKLQTYYINKSVTRIQANISGLISLAKKENNLDERHTFIENLRIKLKVLKNSRKEFFKNLSDFYSSLTTAKSVSPLSHEYLDATLRCDYAMKELTENYDLFINAHRSIIELEQRIIIDVYKEPSKLQLPYQRLSGDSLLFKPMRPSPPAKPITLVELELSDESMPLDEPIQSLPHAEPITLVESIEPDKSLALNEATQSAHLTDSKILVEQKTESDAIDHKNITAEIIKNNDPINLSPSNEIHSRIFGYDQELIAMLKKTQETKIKNFSVNYYGAGNEEKRMEVRKNFQKYILQPKLEFYQERLKDTDPKSRLIYENVINIIKNFPEIVTTIEQAKSHILSSNISILNKVINSFKLSITNFKNITNIYSLVQADIGQKLNAYFADKDDSINQLDRGYIAFGVLQVLYCLLDLDSPFHLRYSIDLSINEVYDRLINDANETTANIYSFSSILSSPLSLDKKCSLIANHIYDGFLSLNYLNWRVNDTDLIRWLTGFVACLKNEEVIKKHQENMVGYEPFSYILIDLAQNKHLEYGSLSFDEFVKNVKAEIKKIPEDWPISSRVCEGIPIFYLASQRGDNDKLISQSITYI